MLINEIARAVVEVFDVGDIGQGIARMLDAIEALRVESLPPLAFAVSLGEAANRAAEVRQRAVCRIRRCCPP